MLRIDLNKAVLVSYPLKAHVSRATPFRQGVARKRNMASGPRKLFLSDPGDRLRARDEQNRFARARITVAAAPDPNHAYLHKPHGQLDSPTSNQPHNASLHPTPHPRVVGTVSSTRNPLTHFQATLTGSTRGSEGSDGCRAHSWTHNPPRLPQSNVIRGPNFTSLARRFPADTSYQELSLRTLQNDKGQGHFASSEDAD